MQANISIESSVVNGSLDLNNYSMGDFKAQSFAEDLRAFLSASSSTKRRRGMFRRKGKAKAPSDADKLIRVLNLRQNRLTGRGVRTLLQQLSAAHADNLASAPNPELGSNKNALTYLDLSCNNMGKAGVDALAKFINTSAGKMLHHLNLEDNKLGDLNVSTFGQALVVNRSKIKLRTLNLSKNSVSESGARALGKYLGGDPEGCSLRELTLSWNNIHAAGAVALSQGLLENESLRVLDLSWNGFGSSSDQEAVRTLSSVLVINSSITHLDMSHNQLDLEDCSVLSEGLAKNSTILGLHMEGNTASIDPAGFVQPKHNKDPMNAHIFSRMINPELTDAAEWRYTSNCWICEKWREVKFTFTPSVSGPCGLTTPVYVLPSFDKWLPDRMKKVNERRELHRMVPPGVHKYCFLVGDNSVTSAKDQVIKPCHVLLREEVPKEFDLDTPTILESNVLDLHHAAPAPSSELQPSYSVCEGYAQDGDQQTVGGHSLKKFLLLMKVKPRVRRTGPHAKYNEWSVGVSVFQRFRRDDGQLLKKCFWNDYPHTNIDRLIKDPTTRKEVQEVLLQNYGALKTVFKYFSATGIESGDVFNMGMLSFTELCQRANIIQDKVLSLIDIDNIFIATNAQASKAKAKHGIKTKLARFQIIEVVIRMAKTMMSHARAKGALEAKLGLSDHLKRLLAGYIRPVAEEIDPNKFREQRCVNQECDEAFRLHMEGLKLTYVLYCGHAVTANKKLRSANDGGTLMRLADFTLLLEDAHVLEKEAFSPTKAKTPRAKRKSIMRLGSQSEIKKLNDVAVRDVRLAFTRSLMTHQDELEGDGYTALTFVEFLEAIARIADIRPLILPMHALRAYRNYKKRDPFAADNAEHMDINKSGVEALFNSVQKDADKHASYTLKLPGGDTSIHLAFKLLYLLPKLVEVPSLCFEKSKIAKGKQFTLQLYDAKCFGKPLKRNVRAITSMKKAVKKLTSASALIKSAKQSRGTNRQK